MYLIIFTIGILINVGLYLLSVHYIKKNNEEKEDFKEQNEEKRHLLNSPMIFEEKSTNTDEYILIVDEAE